MTREEAIRILDPETFVEELLKIEYYGGFAGWTKAAQAVYDACIMAVEALREQEERSKPKEAQTSDCIREKLWRFVKEAIHSWESDVNMSDHITDNLIANGVTVQSDKDINVPSKWIPVTERLPEQGERVLATDVEFVGEFYVNSRGKWKRYNDNDYSLMMALDILWWMPLPEPPKEGAEG